MRRLLAVVAIGATPLAWSEQPAAVGGVLASSDDETRVSSAERTYLEAPSVRPRRVALASRNGNGTKNGGDDVKVWIVEVSVNGQRLKALARVERHSDGTFLLPAPSWAEARLTPPQKPHVLGDGSPAFALNDVVRANWNLNSKTQSLEIDVPARAFLPSTLGQHDMLAEPPPRPAPGILLNYDATISQSQNAAQPAGGVALEAVLFNGFGSFVTSGLVRHDGRTSEAYRLDSFWRYDFPHRMATLVVGDTVGASGGWSRPARYAGVRFGRDFSMRPGFVTLPQLSVTGEATLPSTVDVLVDNARRYSQPVQPGPFDLTNVPMSNGAGEVNLVVRDLLGRESVVTQSYYLSPRLLAPGLSDYSFEAGWLRRGYGFSDSYDKDPFGAITWRQGLTPRLTGEVRLELQPDRQATGIDLNGLLGHWAAARLAMATSSQKIPGIGTQTGQMMQLGLERSTAGRGVSMQYERASRDFSPFGEALLASSRTADVLGQRPRETFFLGVGGTLHGKLSGGLNYVQRLRWSGETVEAIGASLSWSAWHQARFHLSLNKRLDNDREWRAAFSVHIPLGNGVSSSARVEHSSKGTTTSTVTAQRNPPAGPGLGWNIEVSQQDSTQARAGLQYNTSNAELSADASTRRGGDWAFRLGGRGSVGWLAGVPFSSRPVGQGSFAVVEVGGVPGIPVKRSNQIVAYTNADGKAFIPKLVPWLDNQIEIDPIDLPLDVEVNEVTKPVTPYARSGALVKFDLRRTRQALLTLLQPNGDPVPAGARVRLLPDGPEFLAGRRGKVWLTELSSARQQVQVRWNGSLGCLLILDVPESKDGYPGLLGPLTCTSPEP